MNLLQTYEATENECLAIQKENYRLECEHRHVVGLLENLLEEIEIREQKFHQTMELQESAWEIKEKRLKDRILTLERNAASNYNDKNVRRKENNQRSRRKAKIRNEDIRSINNNDSMPRQLSTSTIVSCQSSHEITQVLSRYSSKKKSVFSLLKRNFFSSLLHKTRN